MQAAVAMVLSFRWMWMCACVFLGGGLRMPKRGPVRSNRHRHMGIHGEKGHKGQTWLASPADTKSAA